MFESDELNDAQRDTLAYLVILIVALSMGYFFWVLFSELWVAFFPTVPLFCIKPTEEEEALDNDIEFADIFKKELVSRPDNSQETIRLQTKLETAEGMITQMQTENARLKKQAKTDVITTLQPGRPIQSFKKMGSKKKIDFGATEVFNPALDSL
jgi:hypothetical protein